MKFHRLRVAAACVAASAALLAAPANAQSASEIELARRLDQLAAELASVKAELARMQRERASATAAAAAAAASAPAAVAASPAVVASPVVASESQAQGSGIALGPSTVLTSYGEIHYNRPTHDSSKAVADLTRFVLGLQHRFDEKTKLVTELEVEHAVSSSSDPGEVEIEQAFIERQLARQWTLRAGLFLIPAGLLNENHEPTAFYGVERNFVETAIIPSTWREGGLQVVGSFDKASRRSSVSRPGSISRNGMRHRTRAASRRSARSTRSSRSPRHATSRCSARSTGAAFRACSSAARSSPAARPTDRRRRARG